MGPRHCRRRPRRGSHWRARPSNPSPLPTPKPCSRRQRGRSPPPRPTRPHPRTIWAPSRHRVRTPRSPRRRLSRRRRTLRWSRRGRGRRRTSATTFCSAHPPSPQTCRRRRGPSSRRCICRRATAPRSARAPPTRRGRTPTMHRGLRRAVRHLTSRPARFAGRLRRTAARTSSCAAATRWSRPWSARGLRRAARRRRRASRNAKFPSPKAETTRSCSTWSGCGRTRSLRFSASSTCRRRRAVPTSLSLWRPTQSPRWRRARRRRSLGRRGPRRRSADRRRRGGATPTTTADTQNRNFRPTSRPTRAAALKSRRTSTTTASSRCRRSNRCRGRARQRPSL
mmetsp:Transcript_32518/g.114396  ORF Transcript_32518/g.114396 Transcript_32518/m.114396 type:complete len:339 (+) Transcript_32518:886-1902(+)